MAINLLDKTDEKRAFNDFKKALLRKARTIVGVGAVLCAVTGCQMTEDRNYEPIKLDTNQSSLQSELSNEPTKMEIAYENVDSINYDNIENILSGSKSGIFKHPIYKDQIITVSFSDDLNADEKIKKQLEDNNLSTRGYTQENMQSDFYFGSDENVVSHHIQSFFGNSDATNTSQTDVNLIKINTHAYLNVTSSFLDNSDSYAKMLDNDFEKAHEEFKNNKLNGGTELTKDQLYSGYSDLMHEIGHTFKDQQMSITDLMELPFSNKTMIMLENGATAYELVEALKFMEEKGETAETIKKFLNKKTETSHLILDPIFRVSEKDTHQIIPTIAVIENLYNNNKDFLLNLTPLEVERLSDVISRNVVNVDFSDSFSETLKKENSPLLSTFIDKAQNETKDSLEEILEGLNEKIEQGDFRNKNHENSLLLYKSSLNTIIDNYEDLESGKLSKNQIMDKSFNVLKNDIGKISIDNYDKNALIAEIGYNNLISRDNNLMKEIIKDLIDSGLHIDGEFKELKASDYKVSDSNSLKENKEIKNYKM